MWQSRRKRQDKKIEGISQTQLRENQFGCRLPKEYTKKIPALSAPAKAKPSSLSLPLKLRPLTPKKGNENVLVIITEWYKEQEGGKGVWSSGFLGGKVVASAFQKQNSRTNKHKSNSREVFAFVQLFGVVWLLVVIVIFLVVVGSRCPNKCLARKTVLANCLEVFGPASPTATAHVIFIIHWPSSKFSLKSETLFTPLPLSLLLPYSNTPKA